MPITSAKKRATPRRTLAQISVRKPSATSAELWPSDGVIFDRNCTLCPRLAQFLAQGRKEYPDYYCLPVPPFGDPKAKFIIVGLAPGFHGANATGRPFTGDHAGLLLYRTLHKFGFASRPESIAADDGLKLINCRITNSVKCVPPENKPLPAEIRTCLRYIKAELARVADGTVLMAMGSIGHNAALNALGLKPSAFKFAHAAEHALPRGMTLIDSYHCSRYNTQTRRLTEEMFDAVFARAAELVREGV
ncbi:MAG TPA: uracil-DNA glycosylase [Povalibacter sp.]|uniref:uracil-DNA glycosylase n=1 Tax=Povalibacter sp. TaxID=1962978 RepID=UPI002B91E463|nr:uracil-DNA glycosylase [Povalibacter sp.]HMN47312.1 uracil-DNA glycosylase [Povalibacter sp.]